MKYLKLFEELNYQEVSEDTYDKELTEDLRQHFIKSEIDYLNRSLDTLGSVCKNYLSYTIEVHDSYRFGEDSLADYIRLDIYTKNQSHPDNYIMYKYHDEWYEVRVKSRRSGWKGNELGVWFKCDQLSSVIDLIKDILEDETY